MKKDGLKQWFHEHEPINKVKSSMSNLRAYRLDAGNFCDNIPKGDDQCLWYGVYFVKQLSITEGYSKEIVEGEGLVALVNSDFDCGIKQMDNNEQGYLLLLNHNFLPKGVNQKLKKLHVFIEQGCGPFSLNTEQTFQLNKLFDKILDELSSSYKFKNDLMTILLAQLVHFMIKNFASSPAAA